MPERLRIDEFRRALAGATRAIARDSEVDVAFASETTQSPGKTIRVPSPGVALEPKLVAEARGAADSVALKLRFHDPRLHARLAPADMDARSVFDALETARVEALGARAMGGVKDNVTHLTDARVRSDSIVRARSDEHRRRRARGGGTRGPEVDRAVDRGQSSGRTRWPRPDARRSDWLRQGLAPAPGRPGSSGGGGTGR